MLMEGAKFQIGKKSCLAYLCALAVIGFFNWKQGISYYYADQAKVSGSEVAIAQALRLDPTNPEIYKVQSLLRLKSGDYQGAAETLEKAVKLRKNDYLLWLRLGYAQYKLGNLEAATENIQKSVELAPNYAQTNRYLGRLKLKSGEIELAFHYLGRAAALDDKIYPEILSLARQQFPNDGAAIENSISPKTVSAEKILANYLIEHSLITDNTKNFLLGDAIDDREKQEYIKYLIEKKEFRLARDVWASQKSKRFLLDRSGGALITDGSFALTSESDESGFGWQVNPKIDDAAVSLDATAGHSDNRSIEIVLKGKPNLNENILSQMVVVEPEHNYSLNFYVLSSEIVSSGGIYLLVLDKITGKVIGQSSWLKDSGGKWQAYQISFRSTDSPAVIIALRRTPCSMSPCPIFGDFRMDDFSIVKND
jgi:tetratricopeptide (TPR) repeat protein